MFHSYPNLYIANLFSGPCTQSKKEMIDVHPLKMPNCTQLTSFVDIMSSFHKNQSNHQTSQESQKTSNLSQIRLQHAFNSLDSYLNNTHHTGTTPWSGAVKFKQVLVILMSPPTHVQATQTWGTSNTDMGKYKQRRIQNKIANEINLLIDYNSHRILLSNPCLWGGIQSTRTIPHATWTLTVSAVRSILYCKILVVNPKVLDVCIQLFVFCDMNTNARKGHFWNGCTQGSFWATMCAIRKAIVQWRKQVVRMFGPDLIRINSSIKTAWSAVSNAVFFLRRQPQFLKTWHY